MKRDSLILSKGVHQCSKSMSTKFCTSTLSNSHANPLLGILHFSRPPELTTIFYALGLVDLFSETGVSTEETVSIISVIAFV